MLELFADAEALVLSSCFHEQLATYYNTSRLEYYLTVRKQTRAETINGLLEIRHGKLYNISTGNRVAEEVTEPIISVAGYEGLYPLFAVLTDTGKVYQGPSPITLLRCESDDPVVEIGLNRRSLTVTMTLQSGKTVHHNDLIIMGGSASGYFTSYQSYTAADFDRSYLLLEHGRNRQHLVEQSRICGITANDLLARGHGVRALAEQHSIVILEEGINREPSLASTPGGLVQPYTSKKNRQWRQSSQPTPKEQRRLQKQESRRWRH